MDTKTPDGLYAGACYTMRWTLVDSLRPSCSLIALNVVMLKYSSEGSRVPNSPTGQVLEAGPDWPILVDVDDWTQLTWVVWSGLDLSQTSLYK